jgi:hypothetical protein
MSLPAAKLADAEAPMQQQNFLEKQRGLFQEQRRHHAAAMEYLHQYRADDDVILKNTTRRDSRGLSIESTTLTTTPDAKATEYSYNDTLVDLPFAMDASPSKSCDSTPTSTASSARPYESPDATSSDYKSTRASLEATAALASKIPLPNSFDEQDRDDDDDQFLICQGSSVDDGDQVDFGNNNNNGNIPFESFLRLGASQIVDAPKFTNNGSLADSSDGDDSVIPMTSFMKLGASMLAEAMTASKSDDDNDDEDDCENDNTNEQADCFHETQKEQEDDTAPLTEAGQSQLLEDSTMATSLSKEVAKLSIPDTEVDQVDHIPSPVLQTRDESVLSLSEDSVLVEAQIEDHEPENLSHDYINENVPWKESFSEQVVLDSENLQTDEERNDANLTAEASESAKPLPGASDVVEAITNCNVSTDDEDLTRDDKSADDGESKTNEVNVPTEPPQAVDTDSDAINVDNPAEYIADGSSITQTNALDLSPSIKDNDRDEGMEPAVDLAVSPREGQAMKNCNAKEIETAQVPVDRDGVHEVAAVSAAPPPRLQRRRKKKQKADGYYPSSSLFVSRHFFSR